MLSDDDVEAAVGAGVLTQAQADTLRTFARERVKLSAAEQADEERFRFVRSFNEVFFAIGVALLGGGIAVFAGRQESAVVYLLAAAVMWGLAELLVHRHRLVLPGIVIVLFFTAFAAAALPLGLLASDPMITQGGVKWPALFGPANMELYLVTAVATGVFYLRFGFPFALLPLAGSLVAVLTAAIAVYVSNTHLALTLTLLTCGAVVFIAAMRFDLSDRYRVTRRSDSAFWLHILAAPLLVHSLIDLVAGNNFGTFESLSILVIAVLVAATALVIDRRALLVSALVYVGAVIGQALSSATTDHTVVLIATLIILGGLVLALGIGWTMLRRQIVSVLSPTVANKLPPVAAR